MDLTPITTRLQAEASDVFKIIGTAAEYDAAAESLAAAPAVFVIEQDDGADPPVLCGVVEQSVVVRLACVIAVKLQRDTRGEGGRSALQTARGAVRAALMGWVPDAATGEPITYVGGQMLDFLPGTIWWQDVYQVRETVRNQR